jgi:hypothetical protein
MTTIYGAIAIFGMTALAGIYLLSLFLRSKGTPKGLTLIHGVFAALAIILLIIYCVKNNAALWEVLIIFILAATGGFILNFRDLMGKKVPKWFAILHGLLAVTGFVILWMFAFS